MSDSDFDSATPMSEASSAHYEATTSVVVPYASAQRLAMWSMACISAVTIAIVVVIIANVIQVVQLNQVLAGRPPSQAALAGSDRFLIVGAIGFLVAFFAAAVAFSMWFHRVYRNLPALGARNLLTKPGWAVGVWYIPILNLFRPFQAAREIAVYSEPGYTGDKVASAIGAPLVVKWWWASWIVSIVLARLAMMATERAKDAHDLIGARVISTVGDVVLLSAAVIVIMVIRQITRDQDSRILRFNHIDTSV